MTTASEKLNGFINPTTESIPDWLQEQLEGADPRVADAFACGIVGTEHDEQLALLFVLEDETIAFVSISNAMADQLHKVILASLDRAQEHAR